MEDVIDLRGLEVRGKLRVCVASWWGQGKPPSSHCCGREEEGKEIIVCNAKNTATGYCGECFGVFEGLEGSFGLSEELKVFVLQSEVEGGWACECGKGVELFSEEWKRVLGLGHVSGAPGVFRYLEGRGLWIRG